MGDVALTLAEARRTVEPPDVVGDPVQTLRFSVGLAATGLIAALATLVLWAILPLAFPGWSVSVVSSASMSPRIQEGDVVAVRSAAMAGDPAVGSVVLFDTGNGTTIHRLVELRADGYVTKGDANATPDSERVMPSEIVGVGTILVPWIGHPNRWVAEQRWWLVAAASLGLAVLAHAARWATDPTIDPWRAKPNPDELRLTTNATAAVQLLPPDLHADLIETHRARR